MVLIPGIALLIFCVITLYYEPETKLTKSELISFYGSFLSFVGAFCLGYFIYKRNEKVEETSATIWKCMQDKIDKHIQAGHVLDE